MDGSWGDAILQVLIAAGVAIFLVGLGLGVLIGKWWL